MSASRSITSALAALLLVLSALAPAGAFASEGAGIPQADEPAVHITPDDASGPGDVERLQQEWGDVTVSAEGDAALIEGCSFGVADFSRAQAGSNRKVGDAYHGYNYYVGDQPENLSVVGTTDFAVVYVPAAVLERFGLSLDDAADVGLLKDYLVALDEAHAKSPARLSALSDWRFTSESRYVCEGVVYSFDQEVADGRYYACIIGEDGADVTDPAHPSHVTSDFADFARLVDASAVAIRQEATGLAWLGEFLAGIDYSPLWVTLKTTGCAIVIIFALGLAAAYFTMRISPKAQGVFDAVFTIPMVLPPTVCGFLLLLAFGRNTPLGQWFIDIGFPLIFSWPATVIAAVVVAFPLMYRNSRGAFEGLDPNMLDAARTLGWSNARIFFRLMLPLSWSSIAAATVLAFARALGEFGATLFLAGNYAGITRTIPIAIYFEWMNGNVDVALFWTLVIIAFSFVVILLINVWGKRTTRYRRRTVEE